ncbi:Teichuronic acid biosynthesis protein TuaB [termite gut metagenome]|uniref:Teichuronic acid biosynthesis protein TuaB n=1 Tax=termite gut metagenome TaxID=433724 RepID=A0A5J4S490_9ZZZZ
MPKKSLKSKTIIGIFWNSVERFLVQIVQFILSIIMARLLLPSDYGLLGMLAVFIAISTLFIDAGFTMALIQKKNRTEVDFSTVFYFNIIISICCYFLFYTCAPLIATFYHTAELTSIIRILFLNLIINSLCIIQNTKLSIAMNFKTKAIVNFVSVVVSGCFGVLIAYNGFGVWALVFQILCQSIMNVILLYTFCRWKPLCVFSKESFKQLFHFGSKLLSAGFIATIMNNLYTIFIGKLFSPSQVGYYTRGMQFPALISSTISSILQGVTFPIMTSVQDDREHLISIYRKMIRTTSFFVIPAMTGLAMISEPFIRYFLTEKWMPAVVIMQWICLARLFTPLSALNMNILNAVGRSDLFLKVDLSKLPITMIALIITVPLGLRPVVIGHCITSFIAYFINAYLPGKFFGYGAFRQIKDMLPTLICTGGMMIVLLVIFFYIHSDLLKIVISIIAGVLTYYILAFIFKIEELQDINIIIKKGWSKIS